jgi:hypothetical protein
VKTRIVFLAVVFGAALSLALVLADGIWPDLH